jgi:ribosome silencing factor RsfS/YbeB/iojap
VPPARNAAASRDDEAPPPRRAAPAREATGKAASRPAAASRAGRTADIPPRKPAARKAAPAGRARAADAAPPRVSTTAKLRAAPRAPDEAKALTTAGPAPRKPRGSRAKVKLDPDRLQRLVDAAVASLEADKAEDVTVLDVTGRASFTDRMVIATGLADRQIQAMATHLDEALAKEGFKLNRNAIQGSDDWVLIDCGDMVIHLFKPEARLTYDLEKMWGPDSPMGEPGPGEAMPI